MLLKGVKTETGGGGGGEVAAAAGVVGVGGAGLRAETGNPNAA